MTPSEFEDSKLRLPSNPKARELHQIRQAIRTLEGCEEHTAEPFRIVLNALRQKEAVLLQQVVLSNFK